MPEQHSHDDGGPEFGGLAEERRKASAERRAEDAEFEVRLAKIVQQHVHCIHEKDWGVTETWRANTSKQLDTIEGLVSATNGRVLALERWKIALTASVATLAMANLKGLAGLFETLKEFL
jgi:hypothetical protein